MSTADIILATILGQNKELSKIHKIEKDIDCLQEKYNILKDDLHKKETSILIKIIKCLAGIFVVCGVIFSLMFYCSDKITTFRTVIIDNKLTKQMEQQVKEIKK